MVDTDNRRRTTDAGQRHGYGISSQQVSLKVKDFLRKLSSPTRDLVTLAKLQMALGAYRPGFGLVVRTGPVPVLLYMEICIGICYTPIKLVDETCSPSKDSCT